MKHIRTLRTEADYDLALAEVVPYFLNEPALGTPAAARFDDLAALIEAYEARHWAIEPAGQTLSG
jgi:HTH-type transcriptional regulator/antitoxin HigA